MFTRCGGDIVGQMYDNCGPAPDQCRYDLVCNGPMTQSPVTGGAEPVTDVYMCVDWGTCNTLPTWTPPTGALVGIELDKANATCTPSKRKG